MKPFIALIWLIFSIDINAQKIEKFLDYQDKETDVAHARYYVSIMHTDSGWLRHDYFLREKKLQMIGLFADSACKIRSGRFTFLYSNGQLESSGNYVEGKKDGMWVSYHINGMIRDSALFVKGNPVGTSFRWYRNGFMSDSSVFNADGSGVSVSWFDDGSLSSAGRFSAGHAQHGKWQYFHKNNHISAEEIYDNGKLIARKYFDENGQQEADTTNKDSRSKFPAGEKGWLAYLHKKTYFPPQYTITNAEEVLVVAEAIIDENGKVNDVEIIVPFNPAFDDILKKALLKSPDWIPAISHNRKVKSYIRQPLNFSTH